MGITGLLPFLEKASSACHLRELRGKCVAIDSYCWLHRGAFGCAERLARGEPTDMHIQYCLKYVQLLLSHHIKPILVFDGRHLPAKAATEAKRRENREMARKRGAELLRLGRVEEARSFLRRCVDITHEMALELIRACRKRNVDCVVAPYEADAQLAYLNRMDIAQYVITEDSDLVLFGCNRILFKLDLTGNGRLVEANKLHLAMGCREDRYQFAKFRYMCILSGCDYLDSLPGIGLAKACRFVMKTEEPDVRRALAKIPAYLNMRQLSVSEEYKEEFLKADATFKHMVVFDPVQRKQTRLLDPAEEGTPEQYCCNAGQFLDEQTAFNLALGNLDPFTLRQMDNWHPDAVDSVDESRSTVKLRHPSIWKQNYTELAKEKQMKGMVSVNASQPESASLASFVKRPPPNPDFVAQGTKDTIVDVLHAYGIQSSQSPPLKRLCHIQTASSSRLSTVALEYEDVNALDTLAMLEQPRTPKKARNPFVVDATNAASGSRRDSPNCLLSPTKITPENRSLLQNISPVKRIDYSQQRQSVGKTTVTTTSGRLSRFKRANAGFGTDGSHRGQKVISRFFCSQTKSQVNNLITVSGAVESPEKNGSLQNATYESPTAIVKKIKIKRDCKLIETTAMYLLSPEVQPLTRGDRTPEKIPIQLAPSTPPVKDIIGRLDSGIAMEEDDPKGAELSSEETCREELSSSQKENDESDVQCSQCTLPKPKTSARLALFERQQAKKFNPTDDSEKLAIVFDNRDRRDCEEDAGGLPLVLAQTDLEVEITEPEAVKNQSAERIVTQESGATQGDMGSQYKSLTSRTPCRRPGLSAGKKQPAKSAKNDGLMQSRLSMFGFQKKPTMKLGNT